MLQRVAMAQWNYRLQWRGGSLASFIHCRRRKLFPRLRLWMLSTQRNRLPAVQAASACQGPGPYDGTPALKLPPIAHLRAFASWQWYQDLRIMDDPHKT